MSAVRVCDSIQPDRGSPSLPGDTAPHVKLETGELPVLSKIEGGVCLLQDHTPGANIPPFQCYNFLKGI